MVGEFVMKALHARTNAHVLHLKSRSYARHVALGDFYDVLVDLLDGYVEAYQGRSVSSRTTMVATPTWTTR